MKRKPLLFGVLGGFFLLVLAKAVDYAASLRDWFSGEHIVRSILLEFVRLSACYIILAGAVLGLFISKKVGKKVNV